MNVNLPVVALSVVGVLVAAAGVFTERSFALVGAGVVIILFAWVLQEMTKRQT
ncbi:MAG TPA: hypothetical protein VFC71_01590 [Candidatus Polarisedimenticolia bacterium]|nr:hypothetical protein [Candidatus Polarisedimenticolia bacterium]